MESRRKENGGANYQKRFFKKPDPEAKDGKMVYVSSKHHECISRIAIILGNRKVSIYGIIHNIIDEHLKLHRDEINGLYHEQAMNDIV